MKSTLKSLQALDRTFIKKVATLRVVLFLMV